MHAVSNFMLRDFSAQDPLRYATTNRCKQVIAICIFTVLLHDELLQYC